MLSLSAFADEISPDFDEQLRVCRECGVSHIELRSVEKVNVLDFSPIQRKTFRQKLSDAGIGVISIASPIGKAGIAEARAAHFERFKIAVETAEFFAAPMIRVFSFYLPSGETSWVRFRDEVIARMRQQVEYLGDGPIGLVHENEKDIFGQGGKSCVDLLESVASVKLRAAFDFANFVQVGERPLNNWPGLCRFTTHFHIKDARLKDGAIVQAGEGDGDIAAILVDAYARGYRGFLSMEPHLAAAGQFSGFSGEGLFSRAVRALRELCAEHSIPLAKR